MTANPLSQVPRELAERLGLSTTKTNQAEAVIREAMQKALEAPSLREAINDIPHVFDCDMQYIDGELDPDNCWRCGLEHAIRAAASSLTEQETRP